MRSSTTRVGQVTSQDGDVYETALKVSAGIAFYARAGQVMVSEETANRCDHDALRFGPLRRLI